jgi:omega-6 fatty acid desaturase (delta-12 desaturase)
VWGLGRLALFEAFCVKRDFSAADRGMAHIRKALPAGRNIRKPWIAMSLAGALCAAYGSIFAALLLVENAGLKLLLAMLLGLVTGVMFVLGHDASHGSLLNNASTNRWLARLMFLPGAHPNETWDSEHNRQHHSWTNLSTRDPGYPPLSLAQYRALSAVARAWHRLGYVLPLIALGYLRIWWRGQIRILPERRHRVRSLAAYRLELALIAGFFALQTVLVRYFGAWSGQGLAGFALEWLACIALPFYVWNSTMAFVTLQHHTHPAVRWYNKEAEWRVFSGQVQGTVHVTWPLWFDMAFLNIFQHTAHHADKHVPLYQLRATQRALEAAYPGAITVQPGSLGNLRRLLKTCRLYDYEAHVWLDWQGRPTA